MPSTLSPNMSLILPTVGQEPGPNWALDLNSSLSLVDQHDHSAGSGVQITPSGININTDLSFSSNNAISLRSLKMDSQLAPLALGTDINCIYVSNGNLFYNDNVGNQVQITTGGAVAGTPGSIGNLIAPAAVTYVPGTQTFVFESNQGNATPGSLDGGNLYLRNIVPGGNYIQIQPNAILPSSYSLKLPSALPISTSVLLLDSLGNIATSGTASALSVTTLTSTTINTSALNASSAIAIKNDTGLLQFRNTADAVQFASITGSSSGLTLNLPDTADSYTFQVNGVTKATVNNSGIDAQYLYGNLPSNIIQPNVLATSSTISGSTPTNGSGIYNQLMGSFTITTTKNNTVICGEYISGSFAQGNPDGRVRAVYMLITGTLNKWIFYTPGVNFYGNANNATSFSYNSYQDTLTNTVLIPIAGTYTVELRLEWTSFAVANATYSNVIARVIQLN